MDRFDLSLYLVTDRKLSLGRPLAEVVEAAVQGGVTMVQLREKEASSREFYEEAMALKKILRLHKIPLIINDRLDIALACDAEGLHIGQSDLPCEVARRLLGKDKILGLSVESVEDTYRANDLDIDYIGISPIFGTPTKTDTNQPLGLKGVKEITAISRYPAIGIGGLNRENVKDVIEAGADGVAVVSAIMSAGNPQPAAAELLKLVKNR